uniref:Large ribosomal subunit protein uL23c n=2 Tax=Angiopteris TaxID=3266 RepID=A2T376_ANGEV|nr:ribosomal protein L23 [Angiopteris evecta]YP_009992473.1 ribosomal protein L23 [Angiopteris yunnanensis]YP_010576386.1 ribosomal protein L23 [Angiopteris fokiensis]ABG79643.1 ribosomal protein L23 [Angiopteris evecta]QNN90658.1 ribosomal protein L23 [Angiopteris yunnanensis]UZN43927.1 ribosomal protein L23 [Angiopteris fokiensis]
MDEINNQVLTEKTIRLLQNNQYTFDVKLESTKTEIKDWIEKFFDVKVKAMNSLRSPKKRRNRRRTESSLVDHKRMIITLQSGYSIPLFLNE